MYRWAWVFLIMGGSVLAEDAVIPDPDWDVARAQFTTAINNREPVDNVVLLALPVNHVYFFTDLRHLQERTVTHRWEFGGRVVSIKPFQVGGPRWRVNSRVELAPNQLGEWSVSVVDESGWPLYTEIFHYVAKDPTAPVKSSSPAAETGVQEVIPVVQDDGIDDRAVALPQGVGSVATPEKGSPAAVSE